MPFLQKFWQQYFWFSSGKVCPNMDWNCNFNYNWNFNYIPFEPKFKILKDFSNTVFFLMETTSGQSFSRIKQYFRE